EWLKPSFARSSATMSASVRDQMPKPSCVSCQLGSPTATRFTRTRLSDIVHPVSSSQLTQDPDRVRSFGGYNSLGMTSRKFVWDPGHWRFRAEEARTVADQMTHEDARTIMRRIANDYDRLAKLAEEQLADQEKRATGD